MADVYYLNTVMCFYRINNYVYPLTFYNITAIDLTFELKLVFEFTTHQFNISFWVDLFY